MSFDLNLTTQCDHVVYRELTLLESDWQSIRLSKPMAVSATVEVFVADNILPSTMYDVVTDPANLDARMILLKRKWKSPSDYFEISYTTLSDYCSKCVGYNYLDDITYNVKGSLQILRDEALLLQNIEKFVITRINSNSFHTFIGTGLEGLIGSRVSSVDFLKTQMTAEVSKTLQKLQDLQASYRMTSRPMTSGEILQTINDVVVTQGANNPSLFRIDISVTAGSGKPVQFTQLLRLRI